MKKDVMLSIHSNQWFEGAEEEKIELITGGRFYKRGGKFYVSYDESELTGLAGTKTTLRLDGQNVTMMRTGQNTSHMVFSKGERHVGLYHTPAGMLTISTYTEKVNNNINENGGKIAIDYTIEVEHSIAGKNRFELTISDKNTEVVV